MYPPTPDHHPTWPRAVTVYGTLRSTEGNFSLVRDLSPLVSRADVPGYRLVGYGRGFPFAIPDPEATLVGEVLSFTPETWLEAIRRMDSLEGYPHFYTRRLVTVSTPVGAQVTWIYTPAHPDGYSDLPDVPGGDWVEGGGSDLPAIARWQSATRALLAEVEPW